MAKRLQNGTRYRIDRKASRSLEMTLLTDWLEPQGSKKKVRKYLFAFSKRAAAKHGSKTAPKLKAGEFFRLQRTKGVVYLRLAMQRPGAKKTRYVFFWKAHQKTAANEFKKI